MGVIRNIKKTFKASNFSYVTKFKDGKAGAITAIPPNYMERPVYPYMIHYFETIHFPIQKIVTIDEDYNIIEYSNLFCTKFFYGFGKEDQAIIVTDFEKYYLLNKDLDIIYDFDDKEEAEIIKGNTVLVYKDGVTKVYSLNDERMELKKTFEGKIVNMIRFKEKTYYKFEINNKFGICTEDFEVAIKSEYDSLSRIDEKGNIRFKKDKLKGKINIETGKIY